ncbi:MAG: hypothetical protein ACFFDB_13520 [Promethearchaeota archaeon]
MQEGRKLKGWAKESSDIRADGQNIRKEIEILKTNFQTLQIEVDRILKKLDMKSYNEELRERMTKAEHRTTLQ